MTPPTLSAGSTEPLDFIALQSELERLRVENTQLREDRELDRCEDARRIERLSLMFEVAGRIASSLDLKELLPVIMKDATRVMDAEASSLMLVDEETGDLVFEVALGTKGDEIKSIRVPRGQGLAGWVAEHGMTQLVPDVDKDPRIKKLTNLDMRSMLCSPLTQQNKVIGIVQVINRLDAPGLRFTEEDIPIFEAFADQSATAVSQARLYQDTVDLFDNMIRVSAAALDARDPYTQGHSMRVTEFGLAIAEEVGLSELELKDLRLAGLLHDFGKIGVRDNVLLKPGKLDDLEYAEMKKHPVIGYEAFKAVKQLKNSLPGIRHHHERMDGRGYPDGLKEEDIPQQGRILAVADCLDAMTSNRAYRPGFEDQRALQMISETAGTQHDPRMVGALMAAYAKGRIVTQIHRPDAVAQAVYTAPT